MAEPVFASDLYRGTACAYDRFRPSYPADLIGDLIDRTGADGTGRLLDLACGTGQVAFALSSAFAEVWAVDQEPGMIELASRKPAKSGLTGTFRVPHLRRRGPGRRNVRLAPPRRPRRPAVGRLAVVRTSVLSAAALGDRAAECDADLRRELTAARPDGGFAQNLTFSYDLARRPPLLPEA